MEVEDGVQVLARRILGELEDVLVKQRPRGGGASTCSKCVRVLVQEIERVSKSDEGTKKVFLYGVGREGLMMRGLAMRLFHLGLSSHCVGDMSTPPIGPGDLLLLSAGPGNFSTVEALALVAKSAGGRTLVLTAQPQGPTPQLADVVAYLPAKTMADDCSSTQRDDGSEATGSAEGTDSYAAAYQHTLGTAGYPPGEDLVSQVLAENQPKNESVGNLSILPMGSLYEGTLFLVFEIVVLKLQQVLRVTPDSMRARHTNLE